MIKISEIADAKHAYRQASGSEPKALKCSAYDKRQLAIHAAKRRFPPKVDLVTQLKRNDFDIEKFECYLFGMVVEVDDLPVGQFRIGG